MAAEELNTFKIDGNNKNCGNFFFVQLTSPKKSSMSVPMAKMSEASTRVPTILSRISSSYKGEGILNITVNNIDCLHTTCSVQVKSNVDFLFLLRLQNRPFF